MKRLDESYILDELNKLPEFKEMLDRFGNCAKDKNQTEILKQAAITISGYSVLLFLLKSNFFKDLNSNMSYKGETLQ